MIGGLWKSACSAALFAVAGLVVSGVGATQARAADLGGDCCADLEARVAELEATTARKGNRRVSLTLSGWVSTALLFWDDGEESDVFVVDNTAAVGGTHFVLNGSARINANLTAGFEILVGINAGARSAGAPGKGVKADDDDGGADDAVITMNRANWYLAHKQLGTLRVGRLNLATAGVSAVNLGGTGVIAGATIGDWQRDFVDPESGQIWRDILGGNTVNSSALSRANAVSYTSPTLGGFSVAAAWGEDDLWDVALRYAGEHGGFRVAAAIGYIDNGGSTGEFSDLPPNFEEISQVKGSASILHVASGLFLSGSYVNQDNDDLGAGDTTLWYVQGGITKNWTGLGNTAVYGEWAQVDDPRLLDAQDDLIPGVTANVWGMGVVQHIDAAAMEVFLAYRNFSADADAEDFNDFQAVMSGARIRF